VAPPIFPGYSLSPFDTKSVRMKSEKIDIYYGDLCKIEAVFEIENPTKAIVEKKIGFPFNITAERPWGWNREDTAKKIYDFSMSLNGVNQVLTDVPRSRSVQSDRQYWYGWTCKFKPDLNIVKLTYHTVTSYGNSGYRWEKTLYYNLYSDRNWPGKIDEVQVTVHFPDSINKRQILPQTSPLGYELKGKEVNWRFTSFTTTPEGNIFLDLIDFKFFANMLKYEKVLSAPNMDNATKLSAAKFFASLAPVKGMNVLPPNYFKPKYYVETVLSSLKPTEKALFDSTYKLHKGSRFEYYGTSDYQFFKRNDSLGKAVMEVMNRIGYFEKIEYPVIYKYIEGAKRLFREVVKSEPKNVDAWKAYVENYYYIETGACSPCLPWTKGCDCPESQKELIQEASRNCGNDSTIVIWNNYLSPVRVPFPDTLELERYEQPQENLTIKIKHEDHSWSDRLLSPDELEIVRKVYTMTKDSVFVLSNRPIDEDTEKKLVEILGGCDLYRYKFCSDLEKLQKRRK
jgi:hypothetical protein